MANEQIIKITQNIKNILITIGICSIVTLIIILIMGINNNIDKRKIAETSYLKGKAETMLQDTETLIKSLEPMLMFLKVRIEDINNLFDNIQSTGNIVDEKLQNFYLQLQLVSNAYKDLYNTWKNGGRK